jgi:hypothetical protein
VRRTFGSMKPLDQLRAKIADFPGYDGDLERRRSDQYVRSYLGEALADLSARCPLSSELKARLDALVLRVELADPQTFAARHVIAARNDPSDGGAVAEADAATVELADRAESVDAASAPGYFDEVTAVLDGREAAIHAAALKTQ